MYKFRIKKTGTGVILDGIHELPCSFSISQLDNRKVVSQCKTRRSLDKLAGLFHSSAGSITLKGTTRDGFELLAQGGTVDEIDLGSCRVYIAFRTIYLANGKVGNRIRFFLTNMYLDGQESSSSEMRGRRTSEGLGGVKLFIRSRGMLLENLSDGLRGSKEAQNNRGIAVTSTVTTAYVGDDDSIVEAVDDLVILLTLALGRSVGWVRWEIFDEDGNVAKQQSVDAVVKSWSGVQLIAKRDLILFVEAATRNFRGEASPLWNFRRLILAYNDAKLEHDFLENRALKMAIVLETFKFQFLASNPRFATVLPPGRFKKISRDLRSAVACVVSGLPAPVSTEEVESLQEKIPELNRVAFKKLMRRLYDSLSLELSEDRLDLMIRIRNSLVHSGNFLSHPEPWQQYCLLLTEVGRLLLAALAWKGNFHDWSSNPKSLRKMEYIAAKVEEPQAARRS